MLSFLVAVLLGAGADAGLPMLDGGQDAGVPRDSGTLAPVLAGPPADPHAWQAACGITCYCAEHASPPVCFCSQPAPRDGTVYIFTNSISIHQPDGGVLDVPTTH